MRFPLADFLAKLESEGGVGAMLDYGGGEIIDEYSVPAKLRKDWKELAKLYARVDDVLSRLLADES